EHKLRREADLAKMSSSRPPSNQSLLARDLSSICRALGNPPPPCGEELEVGVPAPEPDRLSLTPPPWPSPQGGGKTTPYFDEVEKPNCHSKRKSPARGR